MDKILQSFRFEELVCYDIMIRELFINPINPTIYVSS